MTPGRITPYRNEGDGRELTICEGLLNACLNRDRERSKGFILMLFHMRSQHLFLHEEREADEAGQPGAVRALAPAAKSVVAAAAEYDEQKNNEQYSCS